MPVLPRMESPVIIVQHRDGVSIRYRQGLPNAPMIETDAAVMTYLAKLWLETCGYEVIPPKLHEIPDL